MSDKQGMTEDEFWAILAPTEIPKIFYRLYYDDRGRPLFWTMQDEPRNYIETDQETYQLQPKHIRVRDGKLVELITQDIKKLVPGTTGACCDPRDVCVVVAENQPNIKWSLKNDETN